MSRHDVLVLPSLHEGFGLVMTEAMGQGLVVITTPHTAGPDLITDSVDGFVIPIRSAAAIEEKLDLLLRDRNRLRAMQAEAREKALAYAWENYRQHLVRLAREVVDTPRRVMKGIADRRSNPAQQDLPRIFRSVGHDSQCPASHLALSLVARL